jgi:hypothetical protein
MAIQGVPGGSSGAPALSARAIYGMGVGPGRLRQPENPSLRQPQGPPFGPGRGTLLPPPPPPPPDPLPPPSLCLPPNPQVQVAPSNPPSPVLPPQAAPSPSLFYPHLKDGGCSLFCLFCMPVVYFCLSRRKKSYILSRCRLDTTVVVRLGVCAPVACSLRHRWPSFLKHAPRACRVFAYYIFK